MKIKLVTDNPDAAIGMRLAGVEGVVAETQAQCIKAINDCVASGDVAIVLITQGLYSKYSDAVDEIKKTVSVPLITEIPENGDDFKSDALTRYVQDAVGMG